MISLDPLRLAREAGAAATGRPATATIHDSPDLRLVVFRLEPEQVVPLHRSVSTVQLTVLAGHGILSGEENGTPVDRACAPGDVAIYGPNELHGMRAGADALLLVAAITPRPGSR